MSTKTRTRRIRASDESKRDGEIMKAVSRIKARMKRIGEERDGLRDDLSVLVELDAFDCIERAEESMEEAIDALSEYL